MNDVAEALRPHFLKVQETLKTHLTFILNHSLDVDEAVVELNKAFVSCEKKIIEKYLNLGMNPNLCLPGDHFPLTHLMTFAVSGTWTDIAKMMIQRGASPNIKDSKGVPVLFSLISSGEVDLVSLALDHGADLEIRGKEGENAVLVAVHYRQIDCLKLLLKHGADANIVDKDGNSAVMWAAGRSNGIGMQRSLTCLKLLVNHCAEVTTPNAKGFTPLMAATVIGEIDAVRLLLSSGADPEARDNKGDTALMKAVDANSEELVKLLIRSNANVNTQNNNGFSPLMRASSMCILEELTLAGADVNAVDNFQKSVLHFQTDAGLWENVRVLLDFGASTVAENEEGDIPLHIAMRRKNSRTISVLIDAGSPISNSNKEKIGLIHDLLLPFDYFNTMNIFSSLNTPALWRELISYTSQYHSLTHRLLDILLKVPLNVNLKGQGDVTPLMLASGCGDMKAVKMLLEAGADPCDTDSEGRTALAYASKAGHEELVRLLMRVGCDPNWEDDKGCLPVYYAAFYQHMDIVLLLMLDLAFYYCSTKM